MQTYRLCGDLFYSAPQFSWINAEGPDWYLSDIESTDFVLPGVRNLHFSLQVNEA